jgi:hypothetical protein
MATTVPCRRAGVDSHAAARVLVVGRRRGASPLDRTAVVVATARDPRDVPGVDCTELASAETYPRIAGGTTMKEAARKERNGTRLAELYPAFRTRLKRARGSRMKGYDLVSRMAGDRRPISSRRTTRAIRS